MEMIIITREELQTIVRASVQEALACFHTPPSSEVMPIGEAVEYMRRHGFITTSASVYGYVSKKLIPFKKVNGKLIFERNAIDGWIDVKLNRRNTNNA